MTGLEAFRDILGILSAVSGLEVDMNSERIKIVREHLKAIEIIKKYFDIEFYVENRMNGSIWGRIVYIQAKEDRGQYDSFASANLLEDIEDFEVLKEVLDNGEEMG